MGAQIARIWNEDRGDMLVVPGTDPEQILKDAVAELDDDERIITTLDEVRVCWWRVSPCRYPDSCGGKHHAHYEDWHGQTRGGFQAASIEIVIGDAPTDVCRGGRSVGGQR